MSRRDERDSIEKNPFDTDTAPVKPRKQKSESSENNKSDTDASIRERMTTLVNDFITRMLSTGDEGWHKVPLRVPQEIIAYSKEQVQALRDDVVATVRRELTNYFGSINLSSELLKLLTYLTFEVRMQIRLVPTEKGHVEIQSKSEVTALVPENNKN